MLTEEGCIVRHLYKSLTLRIFVNHQFTAIFLFASYFVSRMTQTDNCVQNALYFRSERLLSGHRERQTDGSTSPLKWSVIRLPVPVL